MTFPQTTAVEASRNGQEVWRLFTPLVSSGDIYESELSCRAAVIGPDSDIARASITYYDVQNANQANTASVSVSKPYVGRLDALASRTYPTGDRARLLISPVDLIPPPGFSPPSAGGGDRINIIPPSIDVLFYLGEVPQVISPRVNKTYLLEQLNILTPTDTVWFLLPFYGRRQVRTTFKNLGILSQPAVDVRVYGINFSNVLPSASISDNGHQQVLLGSTTLPVPPLGAGTMDTLLLDGLFDYLAIEIDPVGNWIVRDSFITHVTLRD